MGSLKARVQRLEREFGLAGSRAGPAPWALETARQTLEVLASFGPPVSDRFENSPEEVVKLATRLTNEYSCREEYEACLRDPEGSRRAQRIAHEAAEKVLRDWPKIAQQAGGQPSPGTEETESEEPGNTSAQPSIAGGASPAPRRRGGRGGRSR